MKKLLFAALMMFSAASSAVTVSSCDPSGVTGSTLCTTYSDDYSASGGLYINGNTVVTLDMLLSGDLVGVDFTFTVKDDSTSNEGFDGAVVQFSDIGSVFESASYSPSISPTVYNVTLTSSEVAGILSNPVQATFTSNYAGVADYKLLSYSVNVYENVTAVPVPAAGWLFGSGLVGMIVVGRSRNK